MNTWLKITLVIVLIMPWLAPSSAQAAGPWYVAPGGSDSNNCLSPATPCASVGGALVKATSGGTVLVAAGTYTGSNDSVILIEKSVNISGGWDGAFSTQSGFSTIDGQGVRLGLEVTGDVDVSMDHFAVQNGGSPLLGVTGIANLATNLGLTNCLVQDNSGDYPAIVNDGGKTLTMTNCTIRRNISRNSSPAILNFGSMTINNSAIYANQGTIASVVNASTLAVNNSTVSGNTSSGYGGGIYNENVLYLSNSTISGNSSSSAGGGIYAYDSSNTISLRNSILAGNAAPDGPDCSGKVSSAGYNLVGDTTGCSYSTAGGDITNQNPSLGELIGQPGSAYYLPLLHNSPAIDAGNPSGCYDHLGNPLDTDQRGATRNGRCDIGAYEYLSPGPAANIYAFSGSPQHSVPLSMYAKPLKALVLDALGSPLNGVNVTFTAPASGPSGTFAGGSLKTITTPTNESGLATAAVLTANDQEGEFIVTAASNGLQEVQFSLDNLVWYLSPAGKDTNDCLSSAKACATFSAIIKKNSFLAGDSLYAAAGKYLGSDENILLIDKDLKIYAGWDPSFTQQVGTSTLDGQAARRGITVNIGVSAYLEGLTLENGNARSSGGILNYGNLHLKNVSILHNQGAMENYGIPTGGGILNDTLASLTMEDSSINENVADSWDYTNSGGILNSGAMTLTQVSVNRNTGYIGGINNWGNLYLLQSSVNGNSAYDTGGIQNLGTLEVINSSISENSSTMAAGGVKNNGTLIMNNITVSGNIGGLYPYGSSGGIDNIDGEAFINSSTIAGNQGNYAGGIVFSGVGHVSIRNSVLAENQGLYGRDCYGIIESAGYNLVGDTFGCTFQSTTGDLFNKDPKLFALIGSPGYRPLHFTSPAIDAGNPAGCKDQLGNLLASDQRGVARSGRCDIGSYEYNPASETLSYAYLPCMAFNYCKSSFSDEFENPNSGWPVSEDNNHLLAYLEGEYQIHVKSSYWSIGASPGFKMADGTLFVDVRNASDSYGTYGLLFGLSDDWRQFYSFEIDPNGNYGLYRYNEDASQAWTLLSSGYSPFILTSTQSNRLKLVQSGGSISAYANGNLLMTIQESKYTGLRLVGLAAFTENNSLLDLRFDHFGAFSEECNFGGAGLQSQPAGEAFMARPVGLR